MARFKVWLRAFAIWQKLGFNPWEKPRETRKKTGGDFYKGAFDSIPFLNEDAKRTFTHLLLRPGYMIRDYIKGDHERYLAPLTALIVFYAFFALVAAVMQPVQHESEKTFKGKDFTIEWTPDEDVASDSTRYQIGNNVAHNIAHMVGRGYDYLNLDKHPENVQTRWESALAALEGTLRSQGIPLFIGQFFLLWLSMSWVLRRRKMGMAAPAAASAYILCQFSFFMLFALLLTFGESKSVSFLLMLALLTVDLRQWLDVSWKHSFKLALKTALIYVLIFLTFIFLLGVVLVLVAWKRGAA